MFLYLSHDGGVFSTDHELEFEELFCEECGKFDVLLGEYTTSDEARKLIEREDRAMCENCSGRCEHCEFSLDKLMGITQND